MFGLLAKRPVPCQSRSAFRKHYCGTCKTIGRVYGHKYRMLLNHDIVFLAELFAAMEPHKESGLQIQPFSCYKLPKSDVDIPEYVKYVSAANLLLTQYKLEDNIVDSDRSVWWNMLRLIFKPGVQKARKYLIRSGFPVDSLDRCVSNQFSVERNRLCPDEFETSVEYYSQQAASATGLVYSGIYGPSGNDLFQRIGECFGRIVYLTVF